MDLANLRGNRCDYLRKIAVTQAIATAQDCECNGLWLLKNSFVGDFQEKCRARMPYKRSARNLDTFTLVSRC
jgi:hypothetical protein